MYPLLGLVFAISHVVITYCMGFDYVSDTSRTLFRTHGGFQLLTDNAAIMG